MGHSGPHELDATTPSHERREAWQSNDSQDSTSTAVRKGKARGDSAVNVCMPLSVRSMQRLLVCASVLTACALSMLVLEEGDEP